MDICTPSIWSINGQAFPVKEYTIPASKGNDNIYFDEDINIENLSFKQRTNDNGTLTRDLLIFYTTEENKYNNETGIDEIIEHEHKIILQNYFKTTKGDSTSLSYNLQIGYGDDKDRYKVTDLYNSREIIATKNTVGSRFGDIVDSTENKETFTLKQGKNTINFDAQKGFENDTVVLTKGETLNLNIKNIEEYNLDYTRSGNDLIITANVGDIENSIRIKNYVVTDSGAKLLINGKDFETVFDSLEIEKKKDTFIGTRLDDVAKSTDRNETFMLKTGNDEILFSGDYSDYNFGKDTIILSRGENLTLTGLSYANENLSFKRKGNDIIVTNLNENSSLRIKDYLKGYADVKVADVKVADDNLLDLINTSPSSDFLEFGDEERLSSRKAVNLTGTILDETFYGSAKNDIIKAGSGEDTIIAGKGNDKLYGGKGINYYEFSVGDGKDSVYIAKDAENNIVLDDSYDGQTYTLKGNDVIITSELSPVTDETHIRVGNKVYDISECFEEGLEKKPKKGKYTLIDGKYYPTSKLTSEPVIIDTVTVKNYLKGGYDVTVNDEDLRDILKDKFDGREIGRENYSKSQTLKGLFIDEVFYGGNKADKIYTLEGDDEVTAGKGNDTIYLNGAGEKTLNFKKGDGSDTIYMNYNGVTANLIFGADEVLNPDGSVEYSQPEFSFERTGDNLVINRKYTNATTQKETFDKVTVKDYFNNPTDSILKINGDNFTPELVENMIYRPSSSKAINIDFTDSTFANYNWFGQQKDNNSDEIITNFNWEIYGGKKNDSINTGAGNDIVYEIGGKSNFINTGDGDDYISLKNAGGYIYGGEGDDTYTVNGINQDIYIQDDNGNDTLNIITTKADGGDKLAFLFNVNKDGSIGTCSGDNNGYPTEALMIFNQASINNFEKGGMETGYIEISNFFHKDSQLIWNPDTEEYESKDYFYNKIENIHQTNTNGEDITYNLSDDWISQVCSDVAGWLDSTDYTDAMDVMMSGNKDDIKELMNLYSVDTQMNQI